MEAIFTPTAIYQFSGSQMNKLIAEIVSKISVVASPPFAEMNTRQVKQHLAEKGYRVKSAPTLPRLLETYNITPTVRGNENWYRTEDILRIPPKTR